MQRERVREENEFIELGVKLKHEVYEERTQQRCRENMKMRQIKNI